MRSCKRGSIRTAVQVVFEESCVAVQLSMAAEALHALHLRRASVRTCACVRCAVDRRASGGPSRPHPVLLSLSPALYSSLQLSASLFLTLLHRYLHAPARMDPRVPSTKLSEEEQRPLDRFVEPAPNATYHILEPVKGEPSVRSALHSISETRQSARSEQGRLTLG